MTNGEKIKEIFPNILLTGTVMINKPTEQVLACSINYNWLNAEYKEPTNDDCAQQNGCITCSLDDGDDCCRKLFEESMQEPTTKNDLAVDLISRADAIQAMQDKAKKLTNEDTINGLCGAVAILFELPSVTSQLSSELEKNSKELEKDFGELDCISRADALMCLTGEFEDRQYEPSELVSIFSKRIKHLTPQEPRWIPVSERLPKDLEPVNITWINHDPEPYYNDIKDKPFTATGVYFNGQWYWWSTLCTDILGYYSHNYSDIIDDDIEVTAWMPLPKSYSGVEE